MADRIDLSPALSFRNVDWAKVPAESGVYVIYDGDEVIYVGMSGRNGKGNLRNRLSRDSTRADDGRVVATATEH